MAVKKLAAAGSSSQDVWLHALVKEIKLLQLVSFDRNIVQYYGACLQNQASAMLVMEYMAGGDLQRALQRDDAAEYSWERHGRQVATDVTRGLHFLHASGIIHRRAPTAHSSFRVF